MIIHLIVPDMFAMKLKLKIYIKIFFFNKFLCLVRIANCSIHLAHLILKTCLLYNNECLAEFSGMGGRWELDLAAAAALMPFHVTWSGRRYTRIYEERERERKEKSFPLIFSVRPPVVFAWACVCPSNV